MRGGFEAVYDDIPQPLGLSAFAPVVPARGPMFSARERLLHQAFTDMPPPLSESDLYR